MSFIKIKKARVNNLKNVDIDIPRNKIVVVTGVSGSGKSSLAFDTVYAEGQRRYVESLSTHARYFLGQMNKPDVESIEGLSPAVSIQQRVSFGNPRSTVGTITEIYDLLRVLFARAGDVYCSKCKSKIEVMTVEEMLEKVSRYVNDNFLIKAPLIVLKEDTLYDDVKNDLDHSGIKEVEINGEVFPVDSVTEDLIYSLDNQTIEGLYSQVLLNKTNMGKMKKTLKKALEIGQGRIKVRNLNKEIDFEFSELPLCWKCDYSIENLSPSLFSFNSPYGACELCHGLGVMNLLNKDLMVVDGDLSINEGAIPLINIEDVPMIEPNKRLLDIISKKMKIDLDKPWNDLSKDEQNIIMNGQDSLMVMVPYWESGKQKFKEQSFLGFRQIFFDRFHSTNKNHTKDIIKRYMAPGKCPKCLGRRLKESALNVKINEHSIMDLCEMSIGELHNCFKNIELSSHQLKISQDIISEILKRLKYLIDVGLDYLTLSRTSTTLGGGEAQRIKLATQIGSGLTGVLYVLDEPTIGLHARDVERLIKSIKKLKTQKNSVIIVEHDEETILSADHIIELGPKAGVLGGEVIFNGDLKDLFSHQESITAQFIKRERKIDFHNNKRPYDLKNNTIHLTGCTKNNLKNIDVSFPLNCLVSVTGVSGSGKSSLVHKTLFKALKSRVSRAFVQAFDFKKITGIDDIETVVEINQSPIGRTPRSNPATYTGVFDLIRQFYSTLPKAKELGYKASHFSFNVSGGRCEACSGDGMKKIEMHFLPDVYVPCEVCKGKRYHSEIRQIVYKGCSISDVLDSSVDQALEIFKDIPDIYEKLKLLKNVGLQYIKLGQSATNLSGGEAQRVKLASELSNRTKGHAVYILDEPTTGLHPFDVHVLLKVLHQLVDMGHSVIVVEHNMDIIGSSDYVIDMGPEGGHKGGTVIATGSPLDLMNHPKSYTGYYLKKYCDSFKNKTHF